MIPSETVIIRKQGYMTMKKLIAILLCAVLLAGMTAAFADGESWICSECGKESNGNFCPYCGTEKPVKRICPECGSVYSAESEYSFCPECGAMLAEESRSESISVNAKEFEIGKTVQFGRYEQDNDPSNGKETIEWLVLDREDDKALLISKNALDCQPFHTTYTSVPWESSSLRTWLNRTFLYEAFKIDEQKLIQSTQVTADKNPKYDTDPGNETTDKIFLLSVLETEHYLGSETERECSPTAYAIARGGYANMETGNCIWWLRTPGIFQNYAAAINSNGAFCRDGYRVHLDHYTVRPALWISINR